MKKSILGGLAAGAVALGLAVAGPAHAGPAGYDTSGVYGGGYLGDQNAYAYEIQLDGYGTGYNMAQAKDFGLTMCHALATGAPENQIIDSGTSFGIPYSQATLAIHGAEYHFSPAYYR